MHITIIALLLSILGLVTSLFLVGGLLSLAALGLGIYLFINDRTIAHARIIAISAAGVILPVIMYLNTYGLHLPYDDGSGRSPYYTILATNYANLGIDLFGKEKTVDGEKEPIVHPVESTDIEESLAKVKEKNSGKAQESASSDAQAPESSEGSIFESLDSIRKEDRNKGGIVSIAASDDDMPSYGGLPVGTLLIAQYFREDDHNCNPVLVLQNKTGDLVRYECRFIARDAEGEELAISEKTVEVVRDGALFVFEGRFDKRDLGGNIPDSYEFSITKRQPYEDDMADMVSVYTATEGASALLTAENKSDKKVKVDAYVLFFDGAELVDCMWMIPQNTDEVCLDPGSAATIKGDAYYRFDRVETFYTAYEAVGE
ncbi:hypothetical protein D6855_02515 [Butyrivibrio sp. CB08]|uniref:hypothetical protein n=1 Tax=Butyrivibrio sp. CB08 TaxID=2364879 RepID=UPI000EA9BA0C|nr:hypothetical protein [Butyrivibrio sp. CB08]RKM62310.1 hypothetical protein D6855_02515 [Butyrivibrio sp. CB08]